MTNRSPGRRAVRLFYVLNFLDNLTFTLPIWVLFGHDYLGLSYLQNIVVQSVPFYLIGSLLQVFGGAWADRFGRRRAYVLGSVLLITGQAGFFLTRDFWLLLLTIPPIAVGYALRTGSTEALASAACEDDPTLDFHDVTSHGTAVFFLARVIGSPVGAALYSVDPRLPMAANGAGYVLAAVFALRLHETRSPSTSTTIENVRAAIDALRSTPETRRLLLLVALAPFVADISWVAYQPAMAHAGLGLGAIGATFAAMSLAKVAGAQMYRRFAPGRRTDSLFRLMVLGLLVTGAGLVVVTDERIVAVLLVGPLLTAGMAPLANVYLAARTDVTIRATVLSVVLLANEGCSLVSWLIGAALLDQWGTDTVFLVNAVALVGLLAISLRTAIPEPPDAPRSVDGAPVAAAAANVPAVVP